MTGEERDTQRKLKVLRHAEKTSHVAKTCRYFGVGRSSFYRWKAAFEPRGEAGLVNAKPNPKHLANQTPPEIVDKILYLQRASAHSCWHFRERQAFYRGRQRYSKSQTTVPEFQSQKKKKYSGVSIDLTVVERHQGTA